MSGKGPGGERKDLRLSAQGNEGAMRAVQVMIDGYLERGILKPEDLEDLPLGEIYNEAVLDRGSGVKAVHKVLEPKFRKGVGAPILPERGGL